MDKCFVIQPFDNGKYDQRYTDVFKQAIGRAGLEPYRVDKDLSVRIPIEEIERGIAESAICFAEISTDNPNVWYELGFAFACNKDVVMVCSDERQGQFPFDIQHRIVTTYKTSSRSDFDNLEESIVKKIQALIQTSRTVKILSNTPVVDTEGLKGHEIAILMLIVEYQVTKEDFLSVYLLKTEMDKAGYTSVATSVGIRTLEQNEMITTSKERDFNDEFPACKLTDRGVSWVLQNQHLLKFRKEVLVDKDNDLPF